MELVGVRPPKWRQHNANATHKFGTPIALFDGKSMDAWDVQNKGRPMDWTIEDGAMTNTPPANNLVSKQKFQDFKIHAEYKLDKPHATENGGMSKANSGIYLRGRYELQVLDDYGKKPFERGHMSRLRLAHADRQREQACRRVAVDGSDGRGQQGHRHAERSEDSGQRHARGDHRRRAGRERERTRARS